MRILFFCTALFTIQLVNASAIIFSNLPGTSTGGFGICGSCPTSLAQEFTPTGDYTLTDAIVLVGNNGTGIQDDFNVWIAQDSSGLPGTLIEQIGFAVSASGVGGEVIANSISTPIDLTSGTAYWVVLTPANSETLIYWEDGGSPAVPCAVSYTSDGSGDWNLGSDATGQMEIDGTLTSAAPEPTSFALFAVGTGVLAARRFSKSRCTK